MSKPAVTGLILTGGGARAAYQVGVLRAISRIRRQAGLPSDNPFPVIAGTSAGALNAAVLASGADDFDKAVSQLVNVWFNSRVEQVYRTDSLGVIRSGARWLTMLSVGWLIARWRREKPRSLLDNSPLAEFIQQWVDFSRLPGLIEAGHLHALAVSTSSYSTGLHVTFYQSAQEAAPWERSQRHAVRCNLTLAHLMASSAIPFVFPAQVIATPHGPQWFGDGSMRQTAPISPAVHLGADRILVIGAGRMTEPEGARRPLAADYPNLAQIAGHAMSSIFLDALSVDIERLQRINKTLSVLPDELRAQTHLKPIELLVISPSQRLDDIAARHLNALPLSIRALLGGVGVGGSGVEVRGSALASYLLFEADYTRELMALGETDTEQRRDELLAFLRAGVRPAAASQA
ncbi:patatin-like phospholipase family protein [Ideonella sp.]|uniref:patatin-like phospholipase family protein n=1 Tax=Ideonella sp. TaxID=1929293 RepID=UPI003BB7EE28